MTGERMHLQIRQRVKNTELGMLSKKASPLGSSRKSNRIHVEHRQEKHPQSQAGRERNASQSDN